MSKRKVLGIVGCAWALALTLAVSASADPPAGYLQANIGMPQNNGSTTVSATGVWTLMGEGNDFNGQTADVLYFVYKLLQADGSAQGRLRAQAQPGSQYVGVMVRASLDANAAMAGQIMSTSAVNWITRLATDANATRMSGPGSSFTFPKFFRIQRVGNLVTSFNSEDGTLWTQAQSVQLPLGATAVIGLAVSSRSAGVLTTAEFDSVQVLEDVVSVSGVESAATDNLALLVWQPVKAAVGYNIYRGAKEAAVNQYTRLNSTAPNADPFYLDMRAAGATTPPLRDLSYVIVPVFKERGTERLFEGPAVRAR